jgi:hypothetical protein
MRTGELAQKIHVSRIHAWRLAKAGIVPATKKTKGGHFYFIECPKLTRWISKMTSWKFRKKEMARAYVKRYGDQKLKDKKAIKHLRSEFKKAIKWTERLTFDGVSDYRYFYVFHTSIGELTKILGDLTKWPQDDLNQEMIKLSIGRLAILRDLINEWIKAETRAKVKPATI